MNRTFKLAVLALTLALGSTLVAKADREDDKGWKDKDHNTPVNAPEVDPTLALGGLTLLAGSLTVVRARRRK